MIKGKIIKGTTVSFPVRVSTEGLELMVRGNPILSDKKSQNAVLFSSKPDGTAQVPAFPKQPPGKPNK